ncbi:MAG: TetR/AcrR family transcriptional regulator [Gammaproteobacteria bacterium]
MTRTTDKRMSLIDAAKFLIHKQGFNLTTLADIAQEANVPLGNIYYYFKTKDAIGEAVLESRAKELHSRLQIWEQNPDGGERLKALLNYEIEQSESTAYRGCPVGSLCQELAKQEGALAEAAAKLLSDTLNWCEQQFRAMGYGQQSADLASQFMALVQGTALMTNTFKDPKITVKMAALIEDWLKNLRAGQEKSGKMNDSKMLEIAA